MTRNREINLEDLTGCDHEPETPITENGTIIEWRCRCGKTVPAKKSFTQEVLESFEPPVDALFREEQRNTIEEIDGWIVDRSEIQSPDGCVAVQMITPRTMHVYHSEQDSGAKFPVRVWNRFVWKAQINNEVETIYLVNWPRGEPVVARVLLPGAHHNLIAGHVLILPAEAMRQGHHMTLRIGEPGREREKISFVARPEYTKPPVSIGIDMAKDGSDRSVLTMLDTEGRLRASVALEKNKRDGARASLFDIMAAYLAEDALEAVCEECGITVDDLRAGRCKVEGGRLVALPKGEK